MYQANQLCDQSLISYHFLKHLPTDKSRRTSQTQCYVCMHTCQRVGQQKVVRNWCKERTIPLCMECFKQYQTVRRYYIRNLIFLFISPL